MSEDNGAFGLFAYAEKQIRRFGLQEFRRRMHREAAADVKKMGAEAYYDTLRKVFRGGAAEAYVEASREKFITRASFDPEGAVTEFFDNVVRWIS